MSELKRTSLFPAYQESGAKTVDFGGFEMPVQFTGIIAEHVAVRTRAGLFDVSHMGEFEITGIGARNFLQRFVTNDLTRIVPGMAMYSPMTYSNGTTVDDLLIYCFEETRFWAVVNAGNIDKDWRWMNQFAAKGEDVALTNRSEEISLLALQGPIAAQILAPLVPVELSSIAYYRFVETTLDSVPVVLSRTGYTGEDGFELYLPSDCAVRVWRRLLAAGGPQGLLPCGLGARDTLRLEARLPLYGHELTEEITPLEAGLGMFVKLESGEFMGRESLRDAKALGLTRKIVGLRMTEKGIPRQGYRVFLGGQDIGYVTSGTMSPTLKEGIGLALIDISHSSIGTQLFVDIRGRKIAAEVVKTPFYRRPQ